jgi:hypothetical protein
MNVTPLPPYPDPATDSAEEFGSKAAAFVAAQAAFVPEFNQKVSDFEGNMNTLAAGGAYSLFYTVDTATAAADPGAGKLRFNSATQNAATALYVDVTSAGVDVSSILSDFGSSTSAVKGKIRLQQLNDTSKFLTFSVTGVTNSSGFYTLTVTNTGGSTAAPFANGVPVMLFFQSKGDKGDTGAAGANIYNLIAQATISSPVANIDFLNAFSSNYDRYVVEISGLSPSATADLFLLLANSGVVDTTAGHYSSMATDSGTTSSAATLFMAASVTASGGGVCYTLNIRDANSAGGFKSVGISGTYNSGAVRMREGGYTGGATSGFRLYFNGQNAIAGTVRVYGIKNS